MAAPIGGVRGWALRAAREVLTEVYAMVENPRLTDADVRERLRVMLPQALATQERWRQTR